MEIDGDRKIILNIKTEVAGARAAQGPDTHPFFFQIGVLVAVQFDVIIHDLHLAVGAHRVVVMNSPPGEALGRRIIDQIDQKGVIKRVYAVLPEYIDIVDQDIALT